MKRTLMRRQVLKIVGGMALSPWPRPAASAQADGVEQTVAALQTALCVKLLCGRPVEPGRLYYFDLLDMDFETLF